MLLNSIKYMEAAHIGEELFQDKAYELERQCMTVESAVQRKILSLPEALDAYGVRKEEFENYLAKTLQENILTTLHINDGVIDMPMYFKVMIKLFHGVVGDNHPKEIARVDKAIVQLSNEMEAEEESRPHKQVAG